MIDFFKKNKIQLAILLVVIGCIFIPYVLNYRIFLFNADQQLQYNYFYKEWMRLIKALLKTGSFPFYTFNTFLGSNFYASKLYYLTGDIFFPVMLVLSKFIKDISFNLELFSIFYVFLSGISFYIFLYIFGIKNKWYILVGSLLYALSGISSNYVGQYMFHRFYSLLPFLFASIELYRKSGKLTPFAGSVFVLILTSYYFMFPTTLFLVAYSFFTIFYNNEKVSLKSIFKFAYPLIGAYIVGILLSAFLTVPGFLFIKDNSRLGVEYIDQFFEFRVYLGYLHSFITAPLTLFSTYDYMFSVGFNGHLTWYSIYAGTGIVPFIFSTLFIRRDRKITSLRVLLLTLNVFALIPVLSSIMHGFSEPSFRWMFILTFVNILSFMIVLDDFNEYRKEIIKGAYLYLILFVSILFYGFKFKNLYYGDNPIHISIIQYSLLLYFVYVILLHLKKIRIVLVLLVIEVIFTFSTRLWILSESYYYYTPSLDEQAIAYFDEIDEDLFYRIYVNPDSLLPTSTLNLNQSINLNYYSTSTYDSTYSYNLSQFLQMNNINWHIIKLDNPDVLRMLGVKYYYVTHHSELPSAYKWTYRYNVNHFQVFELDNYRSIAFTYSKFVNEDEISEENPLIWNDVLLVPNDLNEKIKDIVQGDSVDLNLIEFSNNRLVGTIEVPNKQMLFISVPYSTGWNVMIDDQKVETYKVQGGFIGVELDEGSHNVVMQFVPPGLKIGVITSGIGFILFLIISVHDFRKRRSS